MIILDVNVCVVAFRQDLERHDVTLSWLATALRGPETIGVPDFVLASVVRLTTNHRIFADPAPPEQALQFCDDVLAGPAARLVRGGTGHWALVRSLVLDLGLRADDIPDAVLAALVLERNAELATFDRGFSRFPGLRLARPLGS